MEININNDSTLSQIQSEFKTHFPHLKLAFFNAGADISHPFSKENMITDTSKTLKEIAKKSATGHISINGHQKVSTLEQSFKTHFGLSVQVFRKSGSSWLLTSNTDELTLAEQNKKSEESASGSHEEADNDFEAYHEQL